MKRFLVVLPREDGGVEVHRLKEWLRQHPQLVPGNLDPTSSTSHQLRSALKKQGWAIEETETEVRLTMPNTPVPQADDVLGTDGRDIDTEEGATTSFALEYQLRDFLAQNLSSISIEGQRLRLYVDPTGRDGVEFPTPVGSIDLLALGPSGEFFVFKLKRANAPDKAIGQLARYMGWVKQTIGKGQQVHGVVVAKSIDDKLRYAACVIPNVRLFQYEVEFHLKVVD